MNDRGNYFDLVFSECIVYDKEALKYYVDPKFFERLTGANLTPLSSGMRGLTWDIVLKSLECEVQRRNNRLDTMPYVYDWFYEKLIAVDQTDSLSKEELEILNKFTEAFAKENKRPEPKAPAARSFAVKR